MPKARRFSSQRDDRRDVVDQINDEHDRRCNDGYYAPPTKKKRCEEIFIEMLGNTGPTEITANTFMKKYNNCTNMLDKEYFISRGLSAAGLAVHE